MIYSYRGIKEVPKELRPREKLKKHGPESLSEEELLAVIFGTGTKGRDVLSLSSDIVRLGWDKVESMSLSELKNLKGLGEVKALQLKALLELSRRIREPFGGVRVLSPEDAYLLLRRHFDTTKESLLSLYLDLSHRVLKVEVIAVGSLNRVFALPKDVLRPAVELSAYGILIAHNHPQGTAEPSKGDEDFTRRLREACELLGFELVDHLILDPKGYFSFRERGLL